MITEVVHKEGARFEDDDEVLSCWSFLKNFHLVITEVELESHKEGEFRFLS